VSNASAKKTSLLLGSSASSPSSGQNIQMYGLTLWRHAIPKWRLINYKDMGKHFFDILLFSYLCFSLIHLCFNQCVSMDGDIQKKPGTKLGFLCFFLS